VVIALSQRVYDQGLSTKVMFSDDLFGFNTYNYAIQREVAQDPKADSVASIFCMHYGNGSLNASATYRAYGGQAMPKGKAAWNSEFGNGSDTWDQSWENSRAICLMLKYGYSAVVYWLLGPHASNAGESVMFNHTPGPKAWGIKAFARYIRPGAVRVDCASDDADVWCIAFAHGGQRTVTLVIMNTASSDRQVTLGGAGLPAQFNVIRTGNGYNCVATGTVRTGETFTAPPQNILTLQTTGVDMTAVSRMSFSSMSGATIRMQPGRTALFSLDGRRVSRTVSTNRAGVLIRTAGKSVAERTASIR